MYLCSFRPTLMNKLYVTSYPSYWMSWVWLKNLLEFKKKNSFHCRLWREQSEFQCLALRANRSRFRDADHSASKHFISGIIYCKVCCPVWQALNFFPPFFNNSVTGSGMLFVRDKGEKGRSDQCFQVDEDCFLESAISEDCFIFPFGVWHEQYNLF